MRKFRSLGKSPTVNVIPRPTSPLVSRSRLLFRPVSQLAIVRKQQQQPPRTAYRLIRAASTNMSFSNTDTGSKPADPYKDKNVEQPDLKEKVQDLVKFIEKSKFGMMTTRIASSGLLVSRAMALAATEGGGVDLLFHTNTESGKTDDLQSDPKINISFLNSSGEWASISGEASIVTDREFVRKHYSPSLKAWLGDLQDGKHDGGPEDPRIGIIKVVTITATYAIASGTMIGRGVEVIKGAITGEAAQVTKLREISEDEIQQYRSSA